MKNIKDLFAAILEKRNAALFGAATVRSAVQEAAGIDVPVESVSLKGCTASLSGLNQAQRSEIFMKKAKILEKIAEKAPRLGVTDIR